MTSLLPGSLPNLFTRSGKTVPAWPPASAVAHTRFSTTPGFPRTGACPGGADAGHTSDLVSVPAKCGPKTNWQPASNFSRQEFMVLASQSAPRVAIPLNLTGAVSVVKDLDTGRSNFLSNLFDGTKEQLTAEELREKAKLCLKLKRRLAGPLADPVTGERPDGKNRPVAIEIDGPSHFYANSRRYKPEAKWKHRLLTHMGYKVHHVPFFEWRRISGVPGKEEYLRHKLLSEDPTEVLPSFPYNVRMESAWRNARARKEDRTPPVANAPMDVGTPGEYRGLAGKRPQDEAHDNKKRMSAQQAGPFIGAPRQVMSEPQLALYNGDTRGTNISDADADFRNADDRAATISH